LKAKPNFATLLNHIIEYYNKSPGFSFSAKEKSKDLNQDYGESKTRSNPTTRLLEMRMNRNSRKNDNCTKHFGKPQNVWNSLRPRISFLAVILSTISCPHGSGSRESLISILQTGKWTAILKLS